MNNLSLVKEANSSNSGMTEWSYAVVMGAALVAFTDQKNVTIFDDGHDKHGESFPIRGYKLYVSKDSSLKCLILEVDIEDTILIMATKDPKSTTYLEYERRISIPSVKWDPISKTNEVIVLVHAPTIISLPITEPLGAGVDVSIISEEADSNGMGLYEHMSFDGLPKSIENFPKCISYKDGVLTYLSLNGNIQFHARSDGNVLSTKITDMDLFAKYPPEISVVDNGPDGRYIGVLCMTGIGINGYEYNALFLSNQLDERKLLLVCGCSPSVHLSKVSQTCERTLGNPLFLLSNDNFHKIFNPWKSRSGGEDLETVIDIDTIIDTTY